MIYLYKGARRLEVWREGSKAFEARISLGFAPEGHKLREGDGRTPEGRYFICAKNAESKYFRALGISYPNARDARAGFRRGAISGEQLRAIERAEERRSRPIWNSALGGFIMLHGEHPEGRTGDWTAGCAALSNAEMAILFDLAELGEAVEILP